MVAVTLGIVGCYKLARSGRSSPSVTSGYEERGIESTAGPDTQRAIGGGPTELAPFDDQGSSSARTTGVATGNDGVRQGIGGSGGIGGYGGSSGSGGTGGYGGSSGYGSSGYGGTAGGAGTVGGAGANTP
jgi:hypothetical protein